MIRERINKLRELMKSNNVDLYLVPTDDFHQSEYVGEHFKERAWITGFTGSAGTALITLDSAYLWTDGRYFIQAASQLSGSGVTLMKMGEPEVPTIRDFLAKSLKEGMTLGFDGRTVSKGNGEIYERIAVKNGAKINYSLDLINDIWEDRPCLSKEPAFLLDVKYTGESVASKLSRIREEIKKADATIQVVTTLDDICWMLNMRGNDITYFPMVLSYAFVCESSVELYMDESKLNDELKAEFKKNCVNVHPYNDVYEDIKKLDSKCVVMLDPSKINYCLYKNIPAKLLKVEARNPQILMKAIKNKTEIENIKKAQIKDSIAHVRFMKWLKENYDKCVITEMSASDKLDEIRAGFEGYIRPSFGPISSYGKHGAIVHYSSSRETDVQLKAGGLFLTDTGAGFYEGSTDVTRTYALGEIPDIQKEHFTLVAISNLNLANARFMEGCTGMNLDYLARAPFWERNLNFNHGTGHGVGYLLNIHEGPAGFRWQYRPGETEKLTEGMIITDEPGIYIEGSHGIRLENEVLVQKGEKNEYGQFMYLETITLIPFDLDAIKPEIMSEIDKQRLNSYHKKVYDTLAPYLTSDEQEWLKKYTRAI